MNNLEASDVVKSSNFNMASKLLEVCNVFSYPEMQKRDPNEAGLSLCSSQTPTR